jgi:hypothetical protein
MVVEGMVHNMFMPVTVLSATQCAMSHTFISAHANIRRNTSNNFLCPLVNLFKRLTHLGFEYMPFSAVDTIRRLLADKL